MLRAYDAAAKPWERRSVALVRPSVFCGLDAYIYSADGTIAMSGPEPPSYFTAIAADRLRVRGASSFVTAGTSMSLSART